MTVMPPRCKICGQSDWRHRCKGGSATAPTETPKTKSAAKFKARKAGKK